MLRPLLLVGVVVVLVVVLAVLPASLATRFVPAQVRLDDLSGTVWHGSAGRVNVGGRDLGALEWHLHPAALLAMSIDVDLHWVKISCVIDARATLKRDSFAAHEVKGSGAIEDLADLGIAPGWRGNVVLDLPEVTGTYGRIGAARGTLDVANVASESVADGAPLGSYQVLLAPDAIKTDGSIDASLRDTGGPVELAASVQFTPASGSAILSGTLKERPDAAQALRDEITSLAQLRPRDAQGRIPVDLEFTL